MTEQETLMDDLERDITKVIQDNRHKMYQRMSAERPSKESLKLKYMVRYYDDKKSLRTKLLKPEKDVSIVKAAKLFLLNTVGAKNNTFWVYDSKQNLIYSQIQ